MKKGYLFFIFIILFTLLVACQSKEKGQERPYNENEKILPTPIARENKPYYKDIAMGKRTRMPLYDIKDKESRIAITIDARSNLSMQFYAVTDFRGISVNCPSFSNSIGSLRLSIYKWDITYRKTLEQEALYTKDFIDFKDSSWLALSFANSLPEDEYLLVIDHIDEIVGVWMHTNSFDNIRLYNREVSIPGSFEAEIEYVNTPDIALGPLSPDYWWLEGDGKSPKELSYVNTYKVKPDTWQAIDGLGRQMPTYEEAGDKRDKYVAMFYWTWHRPYSSGLTLRDLTSLMKEYPEAKNDYKHQIWKDEPAIYFWEEPIYGYYTGSDKYVYRKHAQLLADAGINVIFFDTTNGTEIWLLQYELLCEAWIEAMQDGVNVPKIAFLLNFHDSIENRRSNVVQLEKLYKLLYRPVKYHELWFYWEEKPLIMSRYNGLEEDNSLHKEILNYFTFRPCNPSYFTEGKDEDHWGWLSIYPQAQYGLDSKGKTEQICVGVAQNANDNGLSAMNGEGIYGRSYTKGNYSYTYKYKGENITINKDTDNVKLYGLNFQQQWDYALELDPTFIWVTGWNERTVIRNETWGGVDNAFVDQFDEEYSRDIEPTLGDLKDHYYYQLVMNVRKFKGMERPESVKAEKTIDISKGYDQWSNIFPEFNHYAGNTPNRDEGGLNFDLHYENFTMRNDIVQAKVAYDKDYIYFMVKTVDKISPHTDPAWMRLFIDVGHSDENWESFEYVINRQNPSSNKAILEKSTGGWNFEEIGEVDYTVSNNLLQIKVPREKLGFSQEGMPELTFKWADNSQNDGDIMDFYLNGDVAPGGRFKFAFVKGAEVKKPFTYKANSKVIILLLAIIELALIAFIGLFVWQKKKKKKEVV